MGRRVDRTAISILRIRIAVLTDDKNTILVVIVSLYSQALQLKLCKFQKLHWQLLTVEAAKFVDIKHKIEEFRERAMNRE